MSLKSGPKALLPVKPPTFKICSIPGMTPFEKKTLVISASVISIGRRIGLHVLGNT